MEYRNRKFKNYLTSTNLFNLLFISFQANANNEQTGELRITWGRVITLFAFAVRLSQEYRGVSHRSQFKTETFKQL